MEDYSNLKVVQEEADQYVERLFTLIEKYGGIVDRDVYLTPEEAHDLTFRPSGQECPWIKQYYGESFTNWDSVCEGAIDLAFSGDKRKVPDALRSLANNLKRQATPVWNVTRHSLSSDLSMIGRLKHMLGMLLEHDAPIYNQENTDPTALAHILGYIYKYSPLSQYCPDIWINNLRGYGEARTVSLTDEELDTLAQAVVAIQKAFAIPDHIHELVPNSLESTQTRALQTNPSSAYSLPTMKNAKNKEARAESLKLAYDYQKDPKLYGNVPYVGQRRIQQGGNVLDVYFERIDPSFDKASQYPSLSLLDEAIKQIAAERPWVEYYSKNRVIADGYSRIQPLPASEEQRKALVDQGLELDVILLKFKDGSWRFNFKVSEPCPWKLILDDEDAVSHSDVQYHNMMLSKNRGVFAGSNPIALNKQSIVHKVVDSFKEWTESNGHSHMTASWKEPSDLRRVLTNMAAAVNGVEDASGKIVSVSDEDKDMFGSLSGDDKSGFDNFQSWILWASFNCCILAPVMKEEYHYLIKYTSVETCLPAIMTYQGMMVFSEAMPSGEGSTNFQDGYISAVGGLFDLSVRTKIPPQQIMNKWEKHETGFVFQGDDYQGTDTDGLALEEKQNNFTKLGLKLSIPKSLISKRAMEYTRQFSDCNWRFYPEKQRSKNHLALHAPLAHAMVKVDFGETEASKSPAIDDVSNINRLNNLQFHPRVIDISKEFISYSNMHLGCVNQWYVPLYQVKPWREAGSPEGPSKFHVLIDSPTALVKIAAKDAEFLGSNLDAITDKSWQAQFDDTTKFEDLRVVKILNAIRKNDTALLNELASQIVHQPIGIS